MSIVELPQGAQLEELLRLGTLSPSLQEHLEQALQAPLKTFFAKAGKGLRARVVEAGFHLGAESGDASCCRRISECIEAIHAGSLIIDDIQDGTKVRRGGPTFHQIQGIPKALNAGNLLYFLGLKRLREAGLTPDVELACHRYLHEELLRGHYGQALDVGVPMDQVEQSQVKELCMATIRLKSGVLMALAMTLGATAAGASPERVRALSDFAHQLGMGLQMFDDLRNLLPLPKGDPNSLKRLEDLQLRRPSWVWACAAQGYSARDYADFVRAVHALPDESFLTAWLGIHQFVEGARGQAAVFVEEAFDRLDRELPASARNHDAIAELRAVAKKFMTE